MSCGQCQDFVRPVWLCLGSCPPPWLWSDTTLAFCKATRGLWVWPTEAPNWARGHWFAKRTLSLPRHVPHFFRSSYLSSVQSWKDTWGLIHRSPFSYGSFLNPGHSWGPDPLPSTPSCEEILTWNPQRLSQWTMLHFIELPSALSCSFLCRVFLFLIKCVASEDVLGSQEIVFWLPSLKELNECTNWSGEGGADGMNPSMSVFFEERNSTLSKLLEATFPGFLAVWRRIKSFRSIEVNHYHQPSVKISKIFDH